jgi:hypothetical protein
VSASGQKSMPRCLPAATSAAGGTIMRAKYVSAPPRCTDRSGAAASASTSPADRR